MNANASASIVQTAALTSAESPGTAIAIASASSALNQSAGASGGNAQVELNNSGTLALRVDAQALAHASGDASHAGNAVASAIVTGGILQSAFAGEGNSIAKLENS